MLSMDDLGNTDQLEQQIKLLQEALEQSVRIREQWQHANRQLAVSRASLKESEDLHQEIMQSAFDAIIIADRTGKILEVNRAAADIFGYPLEVLKRLEIIALIPEHLRQKHEHGFLNFIETGEHNILGQCIETEALHQDGHVFPIELAICELNHGHAKLMATIRDISRRKQADEMVHQLSSAIEQAGELILITDKHGVIEYVNPSFTRITGYSPEEAIGQTPRILNSGNQDAAFYEAMWKTITSGKVWNGKVIDRKKDGSFYPAMLTISPIFDDAEGSSHLTHFIGIQSELSALENMEQCFHQAQKMEAIGTMVGGIAHNFNNMLAGMTGNLYLAKRQVRENPDVVQKLANVEDLSKHAAEMIQQLLAFARKGIVNMKEMPLAPFIKGTLKLMHASVPENIAVHEGVCSDDLRIKGDATLLHQVLANLVNNARDAVKNVDDPMITIRLESFHADEVFIENHPYFETKTETGTYAHLSVEDNGVGIPEQQLEHLFEPFFTTKEQGKGTGLGLSMVYGAMKTHHGFVEVESILGKGSRFHIYIPLLEKAVLVVDPVQTIDTAQGQGEMILLADDELVVREVMAEILESMGYQVLQANDGIEAMALYTAHEQKIALALLDVVMPHCGGMALAKLIRAVNPDMPVIFLTGYDKTHVAQGEEAMPNSETLTKPVNFDRLSQRIRKMLD